MASITKLGIFVLTAILALKATTIAAQTLEQSTPTTELWAVIGRRADLLFTASENHMIQFCRWDATGINRKTGDHGIVFNNDDESIPSAMRTIQDTTNATIVPGYSYFGRGLSNGECGVTIDNVTEADITVWKCLVVEFYQHEADSKTIMVNVKRPVAPTPPMIADKSNVHILADFKDGQGIQQTFVCCSENGIPDPKLSFVFDGHVVSEEDVLESLSHNKVCITWKNARFVRSDNGKRVKCESDHLTNSASDWNQNEDYIELNITYGPELLTFLDKPENKSIFIHLSDEHREIKVAYSSNPEPLLTWFVQEGDGFFREIVNGEEFETSSNEVYDAKHTWNAVLALKSYDIKESKNVFKIKLENHYGSEEIFFVNTDSPRVVAPDPVPVDSAFSLWWLVYLSIALVVILVLVAIYVYLAKRNGWLCYRKKIGRYDAEKRSQFVQKLQEDSVQIQHVEDPEAPVYNPTTSLISAPV